MADLFTLSLGQLYSISLLVKREFKKSWIYQLLNVLLTNYSLTHFIKFTHNGFHKQFDMMIEFCLGN